MIHKIPNRAGLLIVIVLMATVTTSEASFINTPLVSPVTTVTFSEVGLANGTVVTDQFSSFGVEFGSLSSTEGLYFGSGAGNPGPGLQNFFPDTYNPFEINFETALTEAAFQMITNGYTDTFTALLNGVVVETASATTGSWAYYGFTDIVFDQIRVNIGGDVHSNDHMRLDNIQIGAAAVPEPTALALMAIGLVGIGYRQYRGKKAA